MGQVFNIIATREHIENMAQTFEHVSVICCTVYTNGPSSLLTPSRYVSCLQEVIRINREFKCCAGCNCCAGANCCSMEVEIEAPVGQVVGYVKQQYVHVHGGTWVCVCVCVL